MTCPVLPPRQRRTLRKPRPTARVSAIKKSIRGLKARASGKTPIPLRERQRGRGTEANEENKELYGLRYLGWLCDVRLPRFSTAPTAHNEKAQASGLGSGHDHGTGGLKARHIRRVPDEPDDAGPSALESFQCPISWGGTPGWYQAAPLALGSGMANGPVCSRIKGLVRSRSNDRCCLRANGPAPSQPMASP